MTRPTRPAGPPPEEQDPQPRPTFTPRPPPEPTPQPPPRPAGGGQQPPYPPPPRPDAPRPDGPRPDGPRHEADGPHGGRGPTFTPRRADPRRDESPGAGRGDGRPRPTFT